MSNEIIRQFDNTEFGALRVVKDDQGEPWFVASDVAASLGYRKASDLTRRIDDDEKGTHSVRTRGGEQMVTVINEAGLYRAILGAKSPATNAFKRWVTHEVLPAIRRDGGYMVARDETPEETMARALLIAQSTIERQTAQIAELKPKALFADAVAASDGTCLIGELAKMMRQNGVDIGQNRLFEVMREQDFLGKSGSNRNVPTQRAMEMGLFRIKETAITHSDGHVTISRTPKVTGKGQVYFLKRFGVMADA